MILHFPRESGLWILSLIVQEWEAIILNISFYFSHSNDNFLFSPGGFEKIKI